MTTKQKTIFLIIIFPVLILVISVFVIYPLFSEIQKSSQNIIEEKKRLVSLEVQAESLEKFKDSGQDFDQNIEKIDSLFVNGEMPLDFINFLEKIKKDYKLSLKISIGVIKKEEKDIWSSITFNINAIGNYDKFMKFLEKIETGPYLTRISDLNLSKGENLNDVEAVFSLKAFVK